MERVPAKERFSRNARSAEIPRTLLEEALLASGFDPSKTRLERLSGGFMNANFLAQGQDRRIVLRVYSSGPEVAERERDILRFLADRPVLVPEVFGLHEAEGRPVLAMEFIDGISLEEKIHGGAAAGVPKAAFREIGEQLAHVHSVLFPLAGSLQAGMRIEKHFDTFGQLIEWFVKKTLNELLDTNSLRIDHAVCRRAIKLVEQKWDLVRASEPVFQLVHCDFNPKNILVGPDCRPLALIDWEFSESGNGLIDLGNFFRFQYDYDQAAAGELISGYRSVRALPENWREPARLLDLGNMCSFLARPEDYQESFRTARIVIADTLEYFGF